ncbi:MULTISPECIES: SpaA isopeptide-forming pilin-related protein [unclassified Paenibacillus]|uniref:DUF7507 domain-containing protein n=1 Tax=unclassified Paenibacillus TaxID=185978 RepID=UPI000954DC39|nr:MULTISPECIES: SpaA isopeptide-forming pilin-related protein [unclassified Paenibacillus]ASS67608.1 DUF11 domain-containing protein [Paenibacillus sp. RUD330]SIQ70876.1 conserved repeat domain-containing protein [Paenibacillus sp. RU4X]SIQ92555.1 conserved repeat domain-containing protein [Paenibacillus sp. RU4T]
MESLPGLDSILVFVANSGENTVSVISTASKTEIARIPVGIDPQYPAAARIINRVYVTNQGSNDVSVIDGNGLFVEATIPVGLQPNGIAVSPDNTTVYVVNEGSADLSVINTAGNFVANTIPLPNIGTPLKVAVANNGERAYVTGSLGFVSVIDTLAQAVIATIPIGPPAGAGIVVDPGSSLVYATTDAGVAVIAALTNTVIDVIAAGTDLQNLAITPDGSKLYATDSAGAVYVIIPGAGIVFPIPTNPQAQGIAITTLREAYTAITSTNSVIVIDTASDAVIAEIPVGSLPIGVDVLELFGETGAVEIFKTDDFGQPLPDVTIRVRGINPPFAEAVGVTDFSGRVLFGNLPLGEYEVVEVNPPVGYNPEPLPLYFTIQFPGEIVFLHLTNFRSFVNIFLRKYDAESGVGIEGVEFLFQGPTFLQVVTGPNGVVSFQLLPGFYYVQEIAPPPGFEPVPPFTFEAVFGEYLDIPNIRSRIPEVTVIKTASAAQANPGDLVTYTIEVINTGEAVLNNLVIEDPLLGYRETVDQLAPGESLFLQVPFTIPPGTPAGPLSNTVTVTSNETTGQATSTVEINGVPGIAVAKQADRLTVVDGGEVVYTITVANTGNVPLTNVVVTDSLIPVSVPPFSLAIGESRQIEVSITAGPPYVQDNRITNTVTVKADQTSPVEDSSVVVVLAGPESLKLTKSVTPSTVRVGEPVLYEFVLTNTSSLTLTNILLTDPVLNLSLRLLTLAPGESVTFEQPYVPATLPPGGFLVNVAVATAVDPSGGEVVSNEASAALNVVGVPALLFSKTADRSEVQQGNTITYTIEVVNVGDTTLTNVRVTDPELGLNETLLSLAPGQSASFERTITVPLTVPPGTLIVNTATVRTDQTPEQQDSVEVIVLPTFGIRIEKIADRLTAVPGDVIQYRIVVRNTGGAELTGVVIQDSLLGLFETIALLVPDDFVALSGSFAVPAGTAPGTVIANVAVVTSDQTPSQSAEAEVTVDPSPSLAFAKTADAVSVLPGDTITYTYTVVNTGNVLLTGVRVQDPLVGLDSVVPAIGPGQTSVLTSAYVVPVDAPSETVLVNTAIASSDQTPPVTDSARVGIDPVAGLTISKTADRASAAPLEAIVYTITVTNTSAVLLTGVVIEDPATQLSVTIPQLAPGESVVLPSQLTVPPGTPAGTVLVNTAVVETDQTPPAEATSTVTVLPAPSLAVSKTSSTPAAFPGETVFYSLTVSNTGNVALTNVVIADTLIGLQAVIPLLEPGASETIRQPFRIPETAPAGQLFVNTATVSSNEAPAVTDSATVSVRAGFSLSVAKSVSKDSALPGETVTYRISLRNDSNAPVRNVRLVDRILGFSQVVTEIPAGMSVVLLADYTVPAFAPGGSIITNTVTVVSDQTPPAQASASLTVLPDPQLEISKQAVPAQARPGQTISFLIRLRNAGNIPLSPVRIRDTLLGIDTVVSLLASGAPLSINGAAATASVPYTIPVDAPAGSVIVNTVHAESPQTAPQQASAEVRVLPSLLDVRKSADRKATFPGDIVKFAIRVHNASGIRTSGLVLSDPLRNGLVFIPGTLVVDGQEASRQALAGLPLGDLEPGGERIIEFSARVPSPLHAREIANIAVVGYTFASDNGSPIRAAARSNRLVLAVHEEEE